MRKFALLSLMLFIALIFTSACGSGGSSGSCDFYGFPNSLGKLTLSKYNFEIIKGSKDTIIAYVDGKDKTNEAIFTVKSEEEATTTKNIIANIEKGIITALKTGTTVINVHVDNTEADKTFTVNVIDPTLPTLQVNNKEINYEIGQDTTNIENIIVTLNGQDVTNQVTFTSTNENVATVNENGKITFIAEGETQVIIHLDGANDQVITITVSKQKPQLSKSTYSLLLGNSDQITVTFQGKEITEDCTFKTENEEIATVDEKGKITAKTLGDTNIITTYNGEKLNAVVNTYDILQNTATNQNGETIDVNSKILSEKEADDMKSILEDTTMIDDTNNIDDVLKIDKTDNVGDVTIDIDREDGTTVVVISYEADGTVKYISTETVQNGQITINVPSSSQNQIAKENEIGTLETVYSLNVSASNFSLNVSETKPVTITFKGEDVTPRVTYTVTDPSIATVENGTITGVGVGTTTVTVSFENANSATFTIQVKSGNLEVSANTFSLYIGKTKDVRVILKGEDVTSQVTYTVDNSSVATVTNGTITGVGVGTTTVTVSLENANSATFTVEITLPTLEISANSFSLYIGKTKPVTVTLDGEDVTSQVIYTVDNSSVATVTNGTITGVSKGTTTVTVSLENANSATFTVEIILPNLEVSANSFSLNVGETKPVIVTLDGEDVTSQVTYTVDNTSIATVTNGTITGVGAGTANVTVSLENANNATFTVDVKLGNLEVSASTFSLNVGATSTVTVTLKGEDVTSQVTYIVTNTSIATVTNGTITGVSKGTTTVTVSLENANSATFTVNVKTPLANAKLGDIIEFGKWHYNADGTDAPLKWIVLSKSGNRLFLLSSRIIDSQYLNGYQGTTWSNSTLRLNWLNKTFYNYAFNAEEKALIESTYVSDPASSNGGLAQTFSEKIYLLSKTEVQNYYTYFWNNDNLYWDAYYALCYPEATPYAKQQGGKYSRWWLRTNQSTDTTYVVSVLNNNVNDYEYTDNYKCGVRPCMWIHTN